MTRAGRVRPTSRDVARVAGVSQSTVSIVLSGDWAGRVSAATASRVRQAATELRYRPNLAARSLRMERSSTVLLVVPALTNPFFAGVHAGAARAAAADDIGIVVCPLGTDDGHDPLPLPRQIMDGLLVFALDDPRLAELWGDLPKIGLECDPRQHPYTVNADIASGTRQLMRHLIALGHRSIGYLHVERRAAWTLTTRLRSLRATVQRHPGLTFQVVPTTFDVREAGLAAATLLAGEARPTALICEDDNLAVAAYAAAQRLGLRIPQDLSVVGYNDLPVSEALTPALTTVRIPAVELGHAGMTALLARIKGEEPGASPLPTTLVVRDSTAAPPR